MLLGVERKTRTKTPKNYNPDLPPALIRRLEQKQKLARKKARQDLLLAVLCFFAGLAFLLQGLFSLRDSYHYSQNYISTEAQVAELKYSSNRQCAVAQFQTIAGQTVKAPTDLCGKTGPGVKIGETVPIFYQPQDLARVYSATFMNRWGGPALLTLLGGLVASTSLLYGFSQFRKPRNG